MNFVFTLSDAAGLIRDIPGEPNVMYLDIENREDSTGVLYMGDEPPGSVQIVTGWSVPVPYLDYFNDEFKNGIEVGMEVSAGPSIPAGTQVLRIQVLPGKFRVHLSAAPNTPGGASTVTYAAPALTELNGISLQPGQRREFTAERGNAFLDRLLRFYAAAGTACNVIIRRGKR